MAASSDMKLYYFNGMGRAEMIRMVLAAAGKKYEDIRLTSEEWQVKKPSTPFGQLPMLEIDGKCFSQSKAISIYLAQEFGLYGKNNMDAFTINQVLDLLEDMIQLAIKFFFEKDEAKKTELATAFTEKESVRFFGYFEKMLSESGTGFFVGSQMTLADIAVYTIHSGMLKKYMGTLDGAPQVAALVEKVGNDEKIKAWVSSRPETPF